MIFLIQMSGFLIQMVPCMFLCFLGFYNLSQIWKERRKYATILAVVLLYSILFAGSLGFFSNRSGFNPSMYGNIAMLICIGIFLIFYFTSVKESGIKKIIMVNLVIFYASAQYMLVNMMRGAFPEENSMVRCVYDRTDLICYIITEVLLFFPMAKIMSSVVRSYMYKIREEYIKQEFKSIVLISCLYFGQMFSYTIMMYMEVTKWLVCGVFLLVTAIVLLFYRSVFSNALNRQYISEYEEYGKIQQLQYEKFTQEMDDFRRMRHDLRHHTRVLYELFQQGEQQQMENYLHELADLTEQTKLPVFFHNMEINALLQYYIGKAEEEGISCKVSGSCDDINVSPVDLTILLGNILENAIRSCNRRENNKWIQVYITVIGAQLVIQISNSCDGISLKMAYQEREGELLPAEAFLTTREGGGQGLKSIELTAKKYEGEARFQYDKSSGSFITRLRLNMQKES